MALIANDFIKPARMLNGSSFPTLEVTKESATTWRQGAIIIATSGYAVEAADGPTANTILGVAAEAAVAGVTTARIFPATKDFVFKGRLGTGDAGGDYTSLVTDRYVRGYGVSLEAATANVWYINQADTTDDAIMIIDFIDTIGTNLALVEFVFISSVWS